MKNSLANPLFSYSHFCDKALFASLLERAGGDMPDAPEKSEALQRLLFELNRYVTMEDVVGKLAELEGYAEAMAMALRGAEEGVGAAVALATLNAQSQRAIRELFVMLDSRDLA